MFKQVTFFFFFKDVSSIVTGKIHCIIAWLSAIKLLLTKCLFINTSVFPFNNLFNVHWCFDCMNVCMTVSEILELEFQF